MPPKPEVLTNAKTEVDTTFLELKLANCNRIVGGLRSSLDKYEVDYAELESKYKSLDVDRADVIEYQKKVIHEKNVEILQLKEKVAEIQEIRETEARELNKKVAEVEKNFNIMRDQLTSANKLLAGKVNALEEFRVQRDDLMNKFLKQEDFLKNQELEYKRIIYDAEKKYIVSKDKLKKEMESRLLKLAQEFQDATEMKIATSTHRVIRENIALNNELDKILGTQGKITEQNEMYKTQMNAAKLKLEVVDDERKEAVKKCVLQMKMIRKMTDTINENNLNQQLNKHSELARENLLEKVSTLSTEKTKLQNEINILEQQLMANIQEKLNILLAYRELEADCVKLKDVTKKAAISVKAAIKLDEWTLEEPCPCKEIVSRRVILEEIFEILGAFAEPGHATSIATVPPFKELYESPDVRQLPKRARSSRRGTVCSSDRSLQKVFSIEDKDLVKEKSVITLGSLRSIPSLKIIPPIPLEEVENLITEVSRSSISEKSGISTIISEENTIKQPPEEQTTKSAEPESAPIQEEQESAEEEEGEGQVEMEISEHSDQD